MPIYDPWRVGGVGAETSMRVEGETTESVVAAPARSTRAVGASASGSDSCRLTRAMWRSVSTIVGKLLAVVAAFSVLVGLQVSSAYLTMQLRFDSTLALALAALVPAPAAVFLLFARRRGAIRASTCALGAAILCGSCSVSTSYFTLGAIPLVAPLGFYSLAVLPGIALWRVFPHRTSIVALWIGALLQLAVFGAEQVWLLGRWAVLHQEARRAAAFAEDERARTGAYPPSLAGYEARWPGIAAELEYQVWDDTVEIDYHLGRRATQHYYWSSSGWGFYDD